MRNAATLFFAAGRGRASRFFFSLFSAAFLMPRENIPAAPLPQRFVPLLFRGVFSAVHFSRVRARHFPHREK
jgi:hypothetical protein